MRSSTASGTSWSSSRTAHSRSTSSGRSAYVRPADPAGRNKAGRIGSRRPTSAPTVSPLPLLPRLLLGRRRQPVGCQPPTQGCHAVLGRTEVNPRCPTRRRSDLCDHGQPLRSQGHQDSPMGPREPGRPVLHSDQRLVGVPVGRSAIRGSRRRGGAGIRSGCTTRRGGGPGLAPRIGVRSLLVGERYAGAGTGSMDSEQDEQEPGSCSLKGLLVPLDERSFLGNRRPDLESRKIHAIQSIHTALGASLHLAVDLLNERSVHQATSPSPRSLQRSADTFRSSAGPRSGGGCRTRSGFSCVPRRRPR